MFMISSLSLFQWHSPPPAEHKNVIKNVYFRFFFNAQIDDKHKDGGREMYLVTQNREKQHIIPFWKVATLNIWHFSCKIAITIGVIDEKNWYIFLRNLSTNLFTSTTCFGTITLATFLYHNNINYQFTVLTKISWVLPKPIDISHLVLNSGM